MAVVMKDLELRDKALRMASENVDNHGDVKRLLDGAQKIYEWLLAGSVPVKK